MTNSRGEEGAMIRAGDKGMTVPATTCSDESGKNLDACTYELPHLISEPEKVSRVGSQELFCVLFFFFFKLMSA